MPPKPLRRKLAKPDFRLSSQSEREGEAPMALALEGATQAPMKVTGQRYAQFATHVCLL
jgi:hypothetical protein